MQIQRQSIPVDHAIYVNSSTENPEKEDLLNYKLFLDDLIDISKNKIIIGYGNTFSLHINHIIALNLININDYDLFLKIDDDDIYLTDYARCVVQDFVRRNWDYSGSHSWGCLEGNRWNEGRSLSSLGLAEADYVLKIPEVMPPTTAFSRRAIRAVMKLEDKGGSDDILWRRHLAAVPGLSLVKRDDCHFIYNIHGGNFSTGHWLET